MEISQYIRDLLFTHDRVILSDFGAFTAKYRPAKIDEKANTMIPPHKEIVFDPTITKDGGLLRDHMVAQEGISADEADKQITEYVKTVKSKLNAGKKVIFKELGSFVKLKDDKIFFSYSPSENLLTDAFGLTNVDIPETKGEKIAMPEKAASEKKPKDQKDKKRYRSTLIFIIVIAIIVLAVAAVYMLKPELIDDGEKYVTELFEEGNISENEGKNESLRPDKDEDNQSGSLKKDETNDPEEDETIVPESTDGMDETKEKQDTQDNTNNEQNYGNVDMKSPKRGHSYLIVASLPTPKLAQEEKNRLKSQGINAEIIPAGANKYRLSVGDFTGFKAATRFYNEFRKKHKKEAWLWEY